MTTRHWIRHDGGRAAAGYQGSTGDCVTRAIAVALTAIDTEPGAPIRESAEWYQHVYDAVNVAGKGERLSRRRRTRGSARTGIHIPTIRRLLTAWGWTWHPTMAIGAGCTVHLRRTELPSGVLIVAVSRHYTCVVDGLVYDTHDPTRDGTRCVYGYWTKGAL